MVGIRIFKNSQKSRKFFGLSWLLPFYTYPANCLVFYLLSSMVFTATVCQVYVSGSAWTEVVLVVQTPIGRENYFSIHWLGTLPTWSMTLWVKKGNANQLDWLHCSFPHVLWGVVDNSALRCPSLAVFWSSIVSWCCVVSQFYTVSPYCTTSLCYTVLGCIRAVWTLLHFN